MDAPYWNKFSMNLVIACMAGLYVGPVNGSFLTSGTGVNFLRFACTISLQSFDLTFCIKSRGLL